MNDQIKFIDLFSGLGGMRIGLEQACQELLVDAQCVLTSEIKPSAIKVYQDNFSEDDIKGNIAQIPSHEIPDFDILLAGFPCQPFSSAGTRQGFLDTRGTLFFEIERILQKNSPFGFILENVEGLVKHDQGKTLKTILKHLEELGYQVTWKVLNAKDFGIPQDRKRIYIAGTKNTPISLDLFPISYVKLSHILETGHPTLETKFAKTLLKHYSVKELLGKAIKDKRGGQDNIHSWDLELKGEVSEIQQALLNQLLKERRKKIWAKKKGIQWMDGMPLTLDEIISFFSFYQGKFISKQELKTILDDLVTKGYLRYEHPKDIMEVINKNDKLVKKREYRTDLEKGYNIVVGKLSFEINKILDPNEITPTLVATDMDKIVVVDGEGLRQLTIREGLRLFGFPETYQIDLPPRKAFDLLGNTVVIPVIREIAKRILVQKLMTIPNQSYNFLPVYSE
ncbi:MAG: DNA (cytosine-5-)-methyltransferase [Microcystaceae cyanobacterium]